MTVTQNNSIQSPVLGDDTAVSRLVTQMRQAIESGELRVGDKVATLRKLAEQYDISFIATRSAIARLEKMGYLTRRRGSGTFVTDWKRVHGDAGLMEDVQAPRTQKKNIALILDNKIHHYGRFYDHLIDCLQLGGYTSSVFTWRNGWGDEEMLPVIEDLAQAPPHAIVLQQLAGGRYDARIDAIAEKHGTRIISSFAGRRPMPLGWHTVHADNNMAAAMAARYLLDHGHRRVGLVTHSRHIREEEPSTLRKSWYGHSDFILGAGHEMRKDGIRHGLSIYYHKYIDEINGGDPMHPVNVQAMKQWLVQENGPTAYIGEDFRIAALLRIAQQFNIRLPDHFQVVGIGNTPWASLMGFPSIWLREDLAAKHVFNLVNMDDDLFHGVAHKIYLRPELVECI